MTDGRDEADTDGGAHGESTADAQAGEHARAGEHDEGTGDAPEQLTHTDDSGEAQMVDVGAKPDTARRAVARGELRLQPSTVAAVRASDVAKGDVLATARIGAVQAVKHTWETIPLCHQIPITNVDTEFDLHEERIVLTVAVETTGKTGCEMEALQGVTTGLNTVVDMVKAAEKDEEGGYPTLELGDVRVVTKEKRPPE
ncbi:cyclic pyranopterin monophosphate synthase MoaC [Halobaculum sp. MBLA0147]|uniref:cyclic pyranopterin monophosphate synthase MoaC n=1 Tax=Halobaculum sp. MBLA0147 TaxID=3079934 RepID=UPI003523E238